MFNHSRAKTVPRGPATDDVFFNHQMTLTALKVARDELNKAIKLMERTRWAR